jgi:hypothetical protein
MEIRPATMIAADAFHQIVDLNDFDVKIAEPSTGKIEAKECRVLGNLRSAIADRETSMLL